MQRLRCPHLTLPPIDGTLGSMSTSRGHRLLTQHIKRGGRGASAALAKQLGVHRQQVSKWLAGRDPSVDFALRLRDAIGIPLESWVQSDSRAA